MSLQELQQLLAMYEEGSGPFNEICRYTAAQFPGDHSANLNAANVALINGDTESAARLLQNAGGGAEADNARAILAYYNDDIPTAVRLFESAAKQGLPAAVTNIASLSQSNNRKK